MKRRSQSFGASLIELIVAVAVFSLVAAQCVTIFVSATELSRNSADLSRAIVLAETAAEAFRATGDCAETAGILGGAAEGNGFTVYYDEASASAEADAEYILVGSLQGSVSYPVCDISVKSAEGGELFSLSVAGGEGVS